MNAPCFARAPRRLATACGLVASLAAAGCSDRPPPADDVPLLDFTPPRDTGRDAGPDAARDADAAPPADVPLLDAPPPDARMDAGMPDAPPDAPADAPRLDAPPLDAPALDAFVDAVSPDAAPPDTGAPDSGAPDTGAPDTGAMPYRRAWTLDGMRDATASETFATTTASYTAYFSWDATTLYAGYEGPDLTTTAADRATKWVMIYIDVDPGSGVGATEGEAYNTQRPRFPAGFRPEYYFRWRADDTSRSLRRFATGVWVDVAVSIPQGRGAGFAEWGIPLSALGSPARVAVASFMLNERAFAEFTYAGLYAGSFTDGYYSPTTPIPISLWLDADFASPLVPNAMGRRRP